jgi:hypothetical protein
VLHYIADDDSAKGGFDIFELFAEPLFKTGMILMRVSAQQECIVRLDSVFTLHFGIYTE